MHWANQYIGIPWISGGTGPDDYDCWGLARQIQRKHFNNDVPLVGLDVFKREDVIKTFKEVVKGKDWEEVTTPKVGDCVLLSQSSVPLHVGVFLKIDGFTGALHAVKAGGVIYTRTTHLKLMGWEIRKIYRWTGEKLGN